MIMTIMVKSKLGSSCSYTVSGWLGQIYVQVPLQIKPRDKPVIAFCHSQAKVLITLLLSQQSTYQLITG